MSGLIINPYAFAVAGGGGSGTVTTFFPLDTANGYVNLGTVDVGDATPTGGGVINDQYVANRPQSYNSQGVSDHLVIPAGSFPDAGSDDWCMEWWAGVDVDTSTNTIFSGGSAGASPTRINADYNGATEIRLAVCDDASNNYTSSGTPAHTAYTMYHWAIIREGDTVYLMFNGAQLGTGDVTGQTFDFTVNEYRALRRKFDSANGVDGSIGEIRFTSGDAVYNTAGYTPPAVPLSA